MSNNITVKVQQKHIDNGEQSDKNTCAIALALSEMFDTTDVSVQTDEILVETSNGNSFSFKWTDIPAKVRRFIERFDEERKSVRPFSFKLPLVKIKK